MEERKLRKGFCKIPNFIAWGDLSGSALKLYVFLASLSPKFRTIRNIKLRRLGMSINTLQRAKKELVKRKVLIIHKRFGGSNYYELVTPNPTQFLNRGYNQYLIENPPQKVSNNIILSDKNKYNKKLKIREEVNKLKNKFSSFKKL